MNNSNSLNNSNIMEHRLELIAMHEQLPWTISVELLYPKEHGPWVTMSWPGSNNNERPLSEVLQNKRPSLIKNLEDFLLFWSLRIIGWQQSVQQEIQIWLSSISIFFNEQRFLCVERFLTLCTGHLHLDTYLAIWG